VKTRADAGDAHIGRGSGNCVLIALRPGAGPHQSSGDGDIVRESWKTPAERPDNGLMNGIPLGTGLASGRRVLLGVTGGIAAYKSADLVRRLVERGVQVQVVMTAAAQQFVTPLTFQAVSGKPVRTDLWDTAAEAAMGHIELARWAELILIAPASADFLARLAHGQANDLLSTLCLASEAPIAVAPAMNRVMWSNPATQANVQTLRSRNVRVLGPAEGEQACGETGVGRMLEPVALADLALGELAPARPTPVGSTLRGQRVLITAGPTRERIDPVRFISNRSSGKMGYAVAQAAREQGAEVVLVSGPVSLPTPAGVRRIDVETAEQMHQAVLAELRGTHIFIGTAAVADYRPANPAGCKIKKTTDKLDVCMERTVDILHAVAQRPDRPFVVGFAAETDHVEEHARAKLVKKNLDLIAANEVGDCKVFEQDDNALTLLWHDGRKELGAGSKQKLARDLIAFIVNMLGERRAAAPRDTLRA
jgi:phosphopantothenoylcysteine decarboxylase/phosphopantothenate--cysteine ligase